MKRSQTALAGLVGLLALVLGMTAAAQTPEEKGPGPFKTEVARAAKQKEAVVQSIFTALGPAMTRQLSAGRKVEVPGVGVFQVVLVAEHRDLVNGIPRTIPASTFIEFVPAASLAAAANASGAVPARVVPAYEFKVNPNAAPSSRIEDLRVPRGRAGRGY